jgi:hypothetical protein
MTTSIKNKKTIKKKHTHTVRTVGIFFVLRSLVSFFFSPPQPCTSDINDKLAPHTRISLLTTMSATTPTPAPVSPASHDVGYHLSKAAEQSAHNADHAVHVAAATVVNVMGDAVHGADAAVHQAAGFIGNLIHGADDAVHQAAAATAQATGDTVRAVDMTVHHAPEIAAQVATDVKNGAIVAAEAIQVKAHEVSLVAGVVAPTHGERVGAEVAKAIDTFDAAIAEPPQAL